MDFEFTNQFASISLANGKSLRCSKQEPIKQAPKAQRALYYFELELNKDPICQQEFLALKEADFPEATNINATLMNFEYPNADLVEVEKVNSLMNYCFFITISREHWLHKTSLYTFIPEFIYAMNKSHLSTRLEQEEEFGCYLKTKLQVPPTNNLQNRIKTISRKIANIHQNVLLSLGG